MNTTAIQPDALDTSPEQQLPGRPRHRLLNRITVPLIAVLVATAGFLAGIEVEKGHGAGTTSATASSGHTIGSGALSGSSSAHAGAHSGASRRGATAASSSGGPPSGGLSASASASGGTTGTITSISGRTIDLETTSGDTIAVRLTSATTLKKDLSVSRNSIHPGDEITVTGISGSGGSITAATVSDAGRISSSSSSS